MNGVRTGAGAACVASALLALAAGPAQAAGNALAGRAKAHLCETCHGMDGVSKVPEAPHLAGQLASYLVTQLHAFQSGDRHNDVMSYVVPMLSAQDIEDLAAYYAAIPVQVGKPPGE